MRCRAFPFWAWNARMEAEEITRQIHEMRDMGYGGFFIHSREGLETVYMSDEWLSLVRHAVCEAEKLGMYAWLYDEDRWPSGTAGGAVTAGNSPYRLTGLTLEVNGVPDSDTIALYAARISGDSIFEMRRTEGPRLCDGETLLVVRQEYSKGSEWFNGSAPPDNLDPKTIGRFIELTHEKYYGAAGDKFGGAIPGIFSDEPSLADRHAAFAPNRSWFPWTDGFDVYFKEVNGYDFWEYAPQLWFDGSASRKMRHDYWKCVTLRFTECFTKQIGEWCRAHNIRLTGHFLWEDRLGTAARTGGAIMPHYEYQDVPGIDLLRYNTEEYLTVKQCVSAARQLGKRNTIAEVYGAAGWELTLEDIRRIGDWLYVLGINRRVQHTCLYSLTGCRKRDYPPSFGYNNPRFKNIRAVEDYFARLGAVLEEGEYQSDILIIHPSTTAWSLLGASPYGNPDRKKERDLPKINRLGEELNDLIRTLAFAHFNSELGDELIMQRHARVEGDRLVIGKASYGTVIMLRLDNLLGSTAELLGELVANGGRVTAVEKLPELIDGVSAPPPEGIGLVKDSEELLALLRENDRREIRISGARSVLMMHRKFPDGDMVFAVNRGGRTENISVIYGIEAQAEEWDALTGEIFSLEAEHEGGGTRVELEIEPHGSRLIRFGESDAPPRSGARAVLPETLPLMSGVTVLDRCRYRIGDEDFSAEMKVWEAQKELRERLRMRPIHENGGLQRYFWADKPHENDGTEVTFRFVFDAEGDFAIAAEHPEYYRFVLNGREQRPEPCGYLLDRGIIKLRFGMGNKSGNELLLCCRYRNNYETENIYLVKNE